MATEFQPYVGPRPYRREDESLFFGRDCEADNLVSLIIAHSVLLLHSQSGAGKTSLINAKLIPMLTQEGFEVLPAARVRGLIPADIDSQKVSNIYVFNTLASWTQDGTDLSRLLGMSIPEFLERKPQADEEEPLPPRVVIFDQFEELFTAYPDRWKERGEFFRQIGAALEGDPACKTKGDRLLRVVFAMRDDYIAELAPYADYLPEKLRTRLRLERLRTEAALDAVKGPLQQSGCAFAEGVAEKLVDDLLKIRVQTATGTVVEVAGEFIEPVQLQVICANLWQKLPPQTKLITSEHLQKFGDVNEALKEFYEEAVSAAVRDAHVDEEQLRNWFKSQLITAAETRGTVFRDANTTGGLSNNVVDVLENRHLIRAELRAGARWYELTHDRFIRPINESNRIWFRRAERERLERERIEAEAQAAKTAAEQEKKAAQHREQERAKEIKLAKDKALRVVTVAAVGVAAIVLGLLVLVFFKWKEADTNRKVAETNRLEANLSAAAAKSNEIASANSAREARQSLARVVAEKFIAAAKQTAGPANTNSLFFAWQAAQAFKDVDLKPSDQVTNWLRRSLVPLTFSTNIIGIVATEFTADGKQVATVDRTGHVSVWDTVSKSQITNFPTAGASQPSFITFNRGASNVIAVWSDGVGCLYKSPSTNLVAVISNICMPSPRSFIRGERLPVVAMNNNGERVAFLGTNGEVRVQNTKPEQLTSSSQQTNPEPTSTILVDSSKDPKERVARLVFGPVENRLAALQQSGRILIYDIEKSKENPVQIGRESFGGGAPDLAWSPDGLRLVTRDSKGTITVWDTKNGKQQPEFQPKVATKGSGAPAFDSSGKRLGVVMLTGDGPVVSILDATSGERLSEIPLPLTQLGLSDVPVFNPTLQSLTIAKSGGAIEVYSLSPIENPLDEAEKRIGNIGGKLPLDIYQTVLKELAPGLRSGIDAAKAGEVEKAIKELSTVTNLPGVRFDPEKEARNLAAQVALENAYEQALAGDTNKAFEAFSVAQVYNPRLEMSAFEAKLRPIRAEELLNHGLELLDENQILQAAMAFTQAQKVDPQFIIPAYAWNSLCWIGCLTGNATNVLYAGEKAVAMEPDDAGYRDTRGLARALSGKVDLAIEDFKFYAEKGQRPLAQRNQRTEWIKQLREGRKPAEIFNETLLKQLRDQ